MGWKGAQGYRGRTPCSGATVVEPGLQEGAGQLFLEALLGG